VVSRLSTAPFPNNPSTGPGGVLPPRGLAGTCKEGTDMAKHTRGQAHIDPDAFRTDVAHALHSAIERARELRWLGRQSATPLSLSC
jgi:hypothetical protein